MKKSLLSLLSATLLCSALAAPACGTKPGQEEEENKQKEEDKNIPLCKTDRKESEMVKITVNEGKTYCIDRYEAFLISGALGNSHQNDDPTSFDGDSSTKAIVGSLAGKKPLNDVSWYQARAACQNSGARLCTKEEWEYACRGTALLNYPYGNEFIEEKCNDNYYYAAHKNGDNFDPWANSGTFKSCRSALGLYDLSGNGEEWIETATEELPDSAVLNHRFVRGGSYASNRDALKCADSTAHRDPNEHTPDRTFRCCKDFVQ